MNTKKCTIPSPLGDLVLAATDDGLVQVHLPVERHPRPIIGDPDPGHPVLGRAIEQFAAYFAGELVAFDLPLAASGTPFQQQVWAALLDIPYGETCSYGAIAKAIGHPSASRAVGAANGRNPLAIIVPCHRVIGASGDLTGYGGGMPAKVWLLAHERRLRPDATLRLFA